MQYLIAWQAVEITKILTFSFLYFRKQVAITEDLDSCFHIKNYLLKYGGVHSLHILYLKFYDINSSFQI